ncbi:MAG: transglutaminase-like domain-containing protein [Melioribacteraceae bacterium]
MKIINQTRRNFLKIAGILASSFALPTKVYPALVVEPNSQKDKFSISYQLRLYSGILRMYDEFDSLPDKLAPNFQYEFSHPELNRLREKYQLDLIAGTGDEWSKALNLMKWISEHIGYKADITSSLPEVCKTLPMNSLGLLEYSFNKGQDFGINCYMHSIVLTEACLSLGLKSRIVSLNPLNPFDYDNHLVTIVWIPKFSKWVMLDSSYNGYLHDSGGKILNPWEVRDLLCRHKTIVCNEELVYNGVKNNSEDYLRYLAKNLFYLHSPCFSGFDSTTTSEKPWLTLTPKHFNVCKRETYNMKWRAEGKDGNWEKDELEQLLKDECYVISTSSISSFSQKPI